jgi:hypothetical protein
MLKVGGGRVYEIGSAWDLRQRETKFLFIAKTFLFGGFVCRGGKFSALKADSVFLTSHQSQ